MSAFGGKADEISKKVDIAIFVPENSTWYLFAGLYKRASANGACRGNVTPQLPGSSSAPVMRS